MTINVLEGGSRLLAVLCLLWVFGASYLTGFPAVRINYDIQSPTVYWFYPRTHYPYMVECSDATDRSESIGFKFIAFRPVIIDLCFITFEDGTKAGQVLYWAEEKGGDGLILARHTTPAFSETADHYVRIFKMTFHPEMNAEVRKYWRFAIVELGKSFLLYLIVGWAAILMVGGTLAWIVSGFLRKPSG